MNYISFVIFLLAGLFVFVSIILTYLGKKTYNNIKLWYVVLILNIISFISSLYCAFGVYNNNNNIIITSFYVFMVSIILALIIMNFF